MLHIYSVCLSCITYSSCLPMLKSGHCIFVRHLHQCHMPHLQNRLCIYIHATYLFCKIDAAYKFSLILHSYQYQGHIFKSDTAQHLNAQYPKCTIIKVLDIQNACHLVILIEKYGGTLLRTHRCPIGLVRCVLESL